MFRFHGFGLVPFSNLTFFVEIAEIIIEEVDISDETAAPFATAPKPSAAMQEP